MCYNCVDRHVEEGNGDKTAFIWESPVTQTPPIHMSYAELQNKVHHCHLNNPPSFKNTIYVTSSYFKHDKM